MDSLLLTRDDCLEYIRITYSKGEIAMANNKTERKQVKKKSGLKILALVVFGATLGAIVGSKLGHVSYFKWLNMGKTFGITEPVKLDLGLIFTSIQVSFKLTVSSILGIIMTLGATN